nr:capsid protein [Cressdnaviricota sp.]
MYYRKRYKRNYRRYSKRRYKRYGYFGKFGSHMGSAWYMAKKALSLINIERKYLDTVADATPSTTEAFVLLNGMVTGDTGQTREGQSIRMDSLLVRYQLTLNASATITAVRAIILLDTQPNAAAPTAAQVLDTTGSMVSPLNIDYGSRFKIISDKVFGLDNVSKKIIEFKRFIKLKDHAKYNTANNGTIADITTNSLYLMHYSSEVTNTPTLSYFIRLRFIDN